MLNTNKIMEMNNEMLIHEMKELIEIQESYIEHLDKLNDCMEQMNKLLSEQLEGVK